MLKNQRSQSTNRVVGVSSRTSHVERIYRNAVAVSMSGAKNGQITRNVAMSSNSNMMRNTTESFASRPLTKNDLNRNFSINKQ